MFNFCYCVGLPVSHHAASWNTRYKNKVCSQLIHIQYIIPHTPTHSLSISHTLLLSHSHPLHILYTLSLCSILTLSTHHSTLTLIPFTPPNHSHTPSPFSPYTPPSSQHLLRWNRISCLPSSRYVRT